MAFLTPRFKSLLGPGLVSADRHPPAGGLLWLVPLIAVGGAISFAFATRPLLAAAALLAVAGGGVIVLFHRALPELFLICLSVILLGYALFGRSFAYLGLPPVFVGEMMLALGLIATLASGQIRSVLRSPVVWLIIVYAVLGLLSTLPYISVYKMEALRDAALWGYSVFAVLVAACVLSTRSFTPLLRNYSRWVQPLAVWLPLVLVLPRFMDEGWLFPGTSEPLLAVKGNDAGVHLAAAAVFVLTGLDAGLLQGGEQPRGRRLFWMLWFLALMIVAALTRGGFLGVMTALMIASLLDPRRIGLRLAPFAGVAVAFALVIVVVSTNMKETSKFAKADADRELSPRQVIENVLSISGKDDAGTLSDTRTWRLDWWTKIVDYTVFGPFFWTGKGFGVNLADDDGFQVAMGEVKTLRSPHSGHMTILARMGVPGAAAWIALNVCFAVLLLGACWRARRAGEWMWAQVDIWILSYWAAFLVSASFDVVLEGPYGGIWFWCVVGFGVAALEVQRTRVPAAGHARRAA